MTEKRQVVRVVCPVEGFEKFWLELNVADWNMGFYVRMHKYVSVGDAITELIPQYSVDWKIQNQDGTVIKHPGEGASDEAWLTVWDSFDVETTRKLFNWFWTLFLGAWREATQLDPKSADDDSGEGGGEESDG